MKKIYAYILLLAVLISSCSDLEPTHDNTSEQPSGIVQGTVTDTDNNLLEHIKITISTNDGADSRTNYTSSEGKFRCEIPMEMKSGQISLDILIEDIDGDNHGGHFETRTDVVTIFEEEGMRYPIIIALPTYRLNPATASANSLQF